LPPAKRDSPAAHPKNGPSRQSDKGRDGTFAVGGYCPVGWLPVWLCLVAGAAGAASPVDSAGVIGLDVRLLDGNGFMGPDGGKRALDYEFCIPQGAGFAAEVRAIDGTARLYPNSRGRIGCDPGQVLVIGNTHQPHFAEVLRRLAALPYVERIEPAWFE